MALALFRDLWLKVFAVALAVLLWVVVAGDPIVERGVHVPLEFENRPSSMEVLGDPPETVEVRLRGSSGVLRRLETGDVAAVIDLGGERLGSRLFDMTDGRVRAPLGVEVTQVTPSTVALLLEAQGAPRLVPIVPVVEGTPAPGFVVGQVEVEPSTVEVVGPLSRLRELTEAFTEPVDINDISMPVDARVTVGLADPNLRLQTPRTARVSVDIIRAPVDRTLAEVPIRIRNAAGQLSATIDPETVTVTVHGARELMRGLDSSLVEASVDLAGLEAGRYNLTVKVEPHRAFRVVDVQPDFVRVALQ